MARDGRPSPLNVLWALVLREKDGAAIQGNGMRVDGGGDATGLAGRMKAAKGGDPKSAAGWAIIRPGCAAHATGPRTCGP